MKTQLNAITHTFIDKNESTDNSYKYWNNESLEKKKIFYDLEKLKKSEEQLFFINEFKSILEERKISPNNVLSVCCGNLWIESNVFKQTEINKLVGIDFSQHRVHKLAQYTVKELDLNFNVELICGDILKYETQEKFDIIYLSKAFHHIESPIFLLRKLKELLNDKGIIIITGEHFYKNSIYLKRIFKHIFKFIFFSSYRKNRSLVPDYGMLFPYSIEKGDIHYSLFNYDYFFKKAGFNYKRIINKNIGFQTFILNGK